MGRTPKAIAEDAPGRDLALFQRALLHECGLTLRAIAKSAYVSHTTLSQNCDGRLRGWTVHEEWINAIYDAAAQSARSMSTPRDAALQHAQKLWNQASCRRREGSIWTTAVQDGAPNAGWYAGVLLPSTITSSLWTEVRPKRQRPGNQAEACERALQQETNRRRREVPPLHAPRQVPAARRVPPARPAPAARLRLEEAGAAKAAEILQRVGSTKLCPRCAAPPTSAVWQQRLRRLVSGATETATVPRAETCAICNSKTDTTTWAVIACLLAASAAASSTA